MKKAIFHLWMVTKYYLQQEIIKQAEEDAEKEKKLKELEDLLDD